jgi:hypothetical protein
VEDYLSLGGLLERPNQVRTEVAGHPHEGGLDPGIQVPAVPMLLEEGVEGAQQFGHVRRSVLIAG